MFINSSGLKVIGSSLCLPRNSKSNIEIWPGTTNWVESNLGIKSRHYLTEGENLISLCIKSALDAIKTADILPSEVDCIIVATSTPDFINPSMAAIVHGAINAREDCPAFDIQAVCAGFVYGLSIVGSLATSNAGKYFLVIGADQFSKITNFDTRDCVFFGDAAASMIIKASNSKHIFAAEIYADGKGWRDFHTSNESKHFVMNGKAVSDMASKKIPEAITSICKKLSIDKSDISYYFTHQPSKLVLDKVENSLEIKPGQLFRNLEKRGNTASASIPSVFFDSNMLSNIKSGDLVCFAAIGSGWVWGVAIMEWGDN